MFFGSLFSERNTAVFAGMVFLACLVYRVALIFFQHPDAGGVEGNVIYFIQRLLDGQPLYTDPEKPPYAIAQYAPLYYYIVAGIARLSGIGPNEILPVFITGRIVSLVFNLAFIHIVYRVAKNIFEVSRERSLIASFLAFIFLEITSFARPDSLYHFLFFLALYAFMCTQKTNNGKEEKNNRLLILSAVIAAIVLFTKQSGLVLPLVIGSWLIWQRKYKATALFAGFYFLTVLLFISIIHFINGTGLFYKNVVQGIDNGISLGWFRTVILPDFYLRFGLILIPLFLWMTAALQKDRNIITRFAVFSLIILFILNNALAIKNGSNPGYFTEWWTLLFVLSAFYWEKLFALGRIPGANLLAGITWLVLILKLVFLYGPLTDKLSAWGNENLKTVYKRDRVIADKINERFLEVDKQAVFLNFNTAESYLSNMLFRNAVMPQMDIVGIAAYPRQKYDYSFFRSELTGGRFKWMIMRAKGPQKQFFNIRLDKYVLQETVDGFNIYQFNP